jgi:hypothetical protein
MPISIVCPGCHKRFTVSDQFAGKKGPCPKCKTVIKVPEKSDEVVVHAPESFGPADSKGRAVLKPITRKETKVSPALTAGILVGIVVVLLIAWMFRSPDGEITATLSALLVIGSIVLAPPLVWGGYSFLRDDELEAFGGRELAIRVAACSAVYAILWGLVAFINWYLFDNEQLDVYHMLFIVPVIVGIGSFAAYTSLDFEFSTGAVHYGLYLMVTLLLAWILGVWAF